MSNMLYACRCVSTDLILLNLIESSTDSIMYKTKLPFLIVFNKTDLKSHEIPLEWMRDFESFQKALIDRKNEGRSPSETGGDEGGTYMDSLMHSMSLVLDEFYKNLRVSESDLVYSAAHGTALSRPLVFRR
jgi:GTPase SAR1 family protein